MLRVCNSFVYRYKMRCFMCFKADGKLQMFKSDMDNETAERIKSVLPDFLIPESKKPVFICSTCLEQISLFYTIKKASLQNCSSLKHFSAILKKTSKDKCNELSVILNNDEVLTNRKHHIEFNVYPKNKYLLSLDEHDAIHIKKEDNEDDDYSQQFVNDEANLNHLQDDESSCISNNSTQQHTTVGCFEFVDTNNFTEKDSNLLSNNSRPKDQPEINFESEKKRFKCADCHKTFISRSKLEVHSRVHTGEKPYKCTTCQKTFTQISSLNSHTLTHTGEKPHECDVCHRTFSQKTNLKSHKRFHIVRPFQCAVCSRGFITSRDLDKHMLICTGYKPHQCHLCEYKSAYANALKTHILYHTGEKPYSCKHCEKSFTTSSHLKKHERRMHSNEDSR